MAEIILKIDNCFSQLITDDAIIKNFIWKRLRFPAKNYWHNPRFKQKLWDGYDNFFQKDTGKFLTGLLPEVQLILQGLKVKYNTEDNRENIEWRVKSINDQFMNFWLAEYNNNVPKDERRKDFTLRDFQPELVNGVLRNNRAIIQSPTGCHAKGQLILMLDGSLKLVEDIVVGDKLMGPDSKPRTVKKLYRGKDYMYKIIPIKGDPFVVNKNHILTLIKTNSHLNRWPSELGGKTIDVTVKDWLKWPKWRKHIHKLIRNLEINFDTLESNLNIEPYFLGLLLGDGSFANGSVAITTVDKEIVKEIKKQAKKHNCLIRKADDYGKRSPTYYFRGQLAGINKNPILNCLRDLGLYKAKSGTKFIPKCYKLTTKDNRLKLLAGLMDTDGSLSNGYYDYVTKSKLLADDISFIARSVGLFCAVGACKKYCQNGNGGVYYRLSICGDINKIPCKIRCKKATVRKQKKDLLRTGFSVKSIGIDDYYGFELEEEPHYLLNDFTITHNSGKTLILIALIKCLPPNIPTLILCNKKTVCDQNWQELKKWGCEIGRLYGTKKDVQMITCATWQSGKHLETLLPAIKVLIVDEVHEMTSKGPRRLYTKLKNCVVRVGLSGTPFKFGEKDKSQKYMVKGYFGPRLKIKSAGETGILTTKMLQNRNELSQSICIFYPIETPLLPYATFQDAVDKGIENNWEFHKIVTRLATKVLKGRTMILVERIPHGDYLANLISDALWVQGKDTLETRKYVLNQLKKAKEDVVAIATTGIFNTGINVLCHNLINTAGGKAEHQIIQRMGRGLRIADDKERLNYYDFYFKINDYLQEHSEKRIKILKKEGHEVILKNRIDF